jgi:hypothetical protein
MKAKTGRLRGVLRQPIDPSKAKVIAPLRRTLAQSTDQHDINKSISRQRAARWAAFDKQFGLLPKFKRKLKPVTVWRRRANALANHFLSGFAIKDPGDAPFGAPAKWSDAELWSLLADVEYEKAHNNLSVRASCARLHYRKRWRHHSEAALRSAFDSAWNRFNSLGVLERLILTGLPPHRSSEADISNAMIGRYATRQRATVGLQPEKPES